MKRKFTSKFPSAEYGSKELDSDWLEDESILRFSKNGSCFSGSLVVEMDLKVKAK